MIIVEIKKWNIDAFVKCGKAWWRCAMYVHTIGTLKIIAHVSNIIVSLILFLKSKFNVVH